MKFRLSGPLLPAGVLLLLFTVTAPATAPAAALQAAHCLKVNDQLFRGPQPSEEGFQALAKSGIKTIIDLRATSSRSEWEAEVVEEAGMRYLAFPMSGLTAPTAEQIRSILKILNDPKQGPVFVHCRRGKDRTGAVIACYRIEHDHWDNAKALKEARDLGMHWFEFPRQQFVLTFSAR